MKRKIEFDIDNSRPAKKLKTDFDWNKIRETIENCCNKQIDDHLVWKDIGQSFPQKIVDGVSLKVYDWYYRCIKQSFERTENTCLKKICDVKGCISHYLQETQNLNSFELMTPDDYQLISNHLDKKSKISDISTGNANLQTKCRLWNGYLNKNGYGNFMLFGKTISSHRAALTIALCREIPNDMVARHMCKNKSCIEHIEIGTRNQNAKDRIRDGTQKMGITHSRAKLSEEMVRNIFWSRMTGKSANVRSKEFGVSKKTISNIDQGETWKHLFTEADYKKVRDCPLVKTYKRLTDDQIAFIKECQEQGLPTSVCAHTMGISTNKVRSVPKRWKI